MQKNIHTTVAIFIMCVAHCFSGLGANNLPDIRNITQFIGSFTDEDALFKIFGGLSIKGNAGPTTEPQPGALSGVSAAVGGDSELAAFDRQTQDLMRQALGSTNQGLEPMEVEGAPSSLPADSQADSKTGVPSSLQVVDSQAGLIKDNGVPRKWYKPSSRFSGKNS